MERNLTSVGHDPILDPILDQFIGQSGWIRNVRSQIQQMAGFHYNVLISGPTGTGKELIARALHQLSPRRKQPFVPVNCAAIPPGLLSSQLFGHQKGAFTGADYASLGCFRAADGGTLFLDEIGELDLDDQAKLLRVLQERAVSPVGSHQSVGIDVRTVAATNRDLAREVREGRFRLDLYYRLNVLSMRTTGLVERVEDIEPLVDYFLTKTAVECGMRPKRLSRGALQILQGYAWPGNVRELQNLMERAVVFTRGDVIHPEAFPDVLDFQALPAEQWLACREQSGPMRVSRPELPQDRAPQGDGTPWPTLAEIERQHLERTLKETFYNQSAAARLLDIDRKLLSRKLRKHRIDVPAGKSRLVTH